MTMQLSKDAIDLGIVVRDAAKALAFYRDTLGMTPAGDGPMPGGAHMYRLMCGTTMVKLLSFEKPPAASAPPGGINGASGYRYFTISVGNIADCVAACEAAGAKVTVKPMEIRPGVTIAMVLDPDGNTVEFLQNG